MKEILASLGAAPSKRRSQNFLVDAAQVKKIASFILAEPGEDIVEIGPGLGALTGHLLESERRITGVEIVRAFCAYLRKTFESDRFKLIEHDAIHFLDDESDYIARLTKPILCGNLPYSITTNLITLAMKIHAIESAVFLTQLEFSDRITSKMGNSFGVFLSNFGQWRKEFAVPAGCFFPRPRVDSALISFQRLPEKCNPAVLELVLRYSFHSKRKKLRNSWQLAQAASGGVQARRELKRKKLADPESREGLAVPFELFLDAATQSGLNPEQRAEEIGAEQYFRMAEIINRSLGQIL